VTPFWSPSPRCSPDPSSPAVDTVLGKWLAVEEPNGLLADGVSVSCFFFDVDPLVFFDVLETRKAIFVLSLAAVLSSECELARGGGNLPCRKAMFFAHPGRDFAQRLVFRDEKVADLIFMCRPVQGGGSFVFCGHCWDCDTEILDCAWRLLLRVVIVKKTCGA